MPENLLDQRTECDLGLQALFECLEAEPNYTTHPRKSLTTKEQVTSQFKDECQSNNGDV